MFVRKKFSVTDDGHTMGMDGADAFETMAEFAVDENIEKDHRTERKLLGSEKTKKKMATRRAFDNRKKWIKENCRRHYERYTLFDAEPHEYGKFRHNGTVKNYSREEIERFETMRAG